MNSTIWFAWDGALCISRGYRIEFPNSKIDSMPEDCFILADSVDRMKCSIMQYYICLHCLPKYLFSLRISHLQRVKVLSFLLFLLCWNCFLFLTKPPYKGYVLFFSGLSTQVVYSVTVHCHGYLCGYVKTTLNMLWLPNVLTQKISGPGISLPLIPVISNVVCIQSFTIWRLHPIKCCLKFYRGK